MQIVKNTVKEGIDAGIREGEITQAAFIRRYGVKRGRFDRHNLKHNFSFRLHENQHWKYYNEAELRKHFNV